MTPLMTALSYVLAGALGFAMLRHLWLWTTERRDPLGALAALWALGVLTTLTATFLRAGTQDPLELATALRFTLVGVSFSAVGLTFALRVLAGQRLWDVGGRLTLASGAAIAVAAGMTSLFVVCDERGLPKALPNLPNVLEPGPGSWLIGPWFGLIIYYAVQAGRAAPPVARREVRTFLVGIAAGSLGAAHDSMRWAGLVTSPELYPITSLGVLLAFEQVMVLRFGRATRDLEEAVAARTLDLTAAVEREAGMAEAARTANAAKTRFLASLSHDLRTPLHSVVGVAQILAKGPLTLAQRQLVSVAEQGADAVQQMLSDLLDLATIESGGLRLHPIEADIGALVDEVVGMFGGEAQRRGIAVYAIRPPSDGGPYLIDAPRLRQILTNLVANAVKFTDEGSVTVEMTVKAGPETHTIRVTVRDTGVGIDAATQSRIWEAFEQDEGQLGRRGRGVGLGLSIAHRLTTAMGGTLDLDSAAGRGAAFTWSWTGRPGGTLEDPRVQGTAYWIGPSGDLRRSVAQNLASLGLDLRDGGEPDPSVMGSRPLVVLSTESPLADRWKEAAVRFRAPTIQLLRQGAPALLSPARAGWVTLALPVSRQHWVAALQDARLETSSELHVIGGGAPQPVRVLVVDDEPTSRRITGAIFEALGAAAVECGSGAEALAAVREAVFDLVVLDLNLPDISGLELAKQLPTVARSQGGNALGMALLSGDTSPGTAAAARALGLSAVVTKPASFESLRALLRGYEGLPARDTPTSVVDERRISWLRAALGHQAADTRIRLRTAVESLGQHWAAEAEQALSERDVPRLRRAIEGPIAASIELGFSDTTAHLQELGAAGAVHRWVEATQAYHRARHAWDRGRAELGLGA